MIDKIQYPASLAPSFPTEDKRHTQWERERLEQGFDNTELWNLDATFARLMLPRVLAYMDYTEDTIIRDESWKGQMTAIITMLEIMASDEKVYDEVVSDKIELGLKLFAEHIGGLWY